MKAGRVMLALGHTELATAGMNIQKMERQFCNELNQFFQTISLLLRLMKHLRGVAYSAQRGEVADLQPDFR